MALSETSKNNPTTTKIPKILFIEPFYGGSHKALIDAMTASLEDYTLVSLSAKKWHWRARCGSLMVQSLIPEITDEEVLFCSCVLNLAELLGLRPDLHPLKKIVYFHENQLVYPIKEIKERDIQFSYNQIITCLAGDIVLFNSEFNRTSFLDNLGKIIKMLPDYRPKNIRECVEHKSHVIYFPIQFPRLLTVGERLCETLHIVWPHRWEFDKGPEDFFAVLFRLKDDKVPFKVSILGESFTDNPEIFSLAKNYLQAEIAHFGHVKEKSEYFKILSSAHVVVSTAKHEFFGVAMLEAVYCGCYPLAPNSLVYPEIYPPECLFSDTEKLYERLKQFCLAPSLVKEARNKLNLDFNKYSSTNVIENVYKIINNS